LPTLPAIKDFVRFPTACYMLTVMRQRVRFSVDSGMVVVIFISLGYLVLVFGLLFYVKNEWCDLLFKNMTVRITK
jgi:hypothetical protein